MLSGNALSFIREHSKTPLIFSNCISIFLTHICILNHQNVWIIKKFVIFDISLFLLKRSRKSNETSLRNGLKLFYGVSCILIAVVLNISIKMSYEFHDTLGSNHNWCNGNYLLRSFTSTERILLTKSFRQPHKREGEVIGLTVEYFQSIQEKSVCKIGTEYHRIIRRRFMLLPNPLTCISLGRMLLHKAKYLCP